MNRPGVIVVTAAAIFAIVLPLFLKSYGIYLSSSWAVLSIAAMGLNLTLGYAGQVSLAQGAFVGIGAYTTALLMHTGVPYPLCFIASGFVCFAIGWVLGYPALRVQHHYLAFVTLAFTTLVYPRSAQRGMAHRRHLRLERHRSAGPARLVDRTVRCASTISASA